MKKVKTGFDKRQFKKNLKRYKEKALKLGASNACVYPVKDIPVDERVILKCQVPRCFGYGVSANCPPSTIPPDALRRYFAKYKCALFFIKDIPPEVIVKDKATIKERVAVYQEVYKIVSDIESMAFYDRYYLSFGLGADSCRHTLGTLAGIIIIQ